MRRSIFRLWHSPEEPASVEKVRSLGRYGRKWRSLETA